MHVDSPPEVPQFSNGKADNCHSQVREKKRKQSQAVSPLTKRDHDFKVCIFPQYIVDLKMY